ncbi:MULTISPECIES: O-antigen ligase family protein [unclassified Bradyrhizobium]|uniref:O-antigen ligase family protein n=1 Tax=unclassified Bradyrhizobium TaxID=2631580 RepID=UPI001FF8DA0C|nr:MULTISPECIES: O-antigen ligase family protein [unclassified Bradyrhizobium]MCK1521853.1 O-antigen ligase family protein [Bradyrhizobium sp. 17]MCK1688033.1 O-antigen ligase family protein [Bradyrhizobium sp. 145]
MFSAATNMHFAREQRVAQPPLHTSLKSQSEGRAAAWRLRLIIAALFLPEGLSFFVGDFRLTVARALLIIFTATTLLNRQKSARAFGMSDFFALAAAVWMLIAGTANEGFAGLKGAGIAAIEFAGCYYVFRCSLDSVDSSVRMVRYACKVLVVVVAVALLDPLTGKLFTYEFAKGLTGYTKPIVEEALAQHAEAMFRNGLLRAMGPLEHSILFGCVCAWFGTLAFFTFPHRLFGQSIAAFALVGLWFSQARGAWVAYVISFALSGYFAATKQIPMRWKLIGSITAFALVLIFSFSGAPFATLMRLAGLSPEAAYYRQGIWAAAAPMVAHSPLFGIGSSWDWQSSMDLYGPSVDAFWLQNSMTYGIPSTLFVFLTMTSPFWRGPIHDSAYLTAEESRLSVALGIVTVAAVFLGFIVHFWGVCWILLGAFAATRASLADSATLRHRTEQVLDAYQHAGRIAAPVGARLRL